MKFYPKNLAGSKHFGTIVPIILLLLFAASLFLNISHPLLWNDESETVMYGSRVLDYGYPKIHDTSNRSIYLLADPIAKKENIDAYVGTSWGQFYMAAIGVALAKPVENIFHKTALIRIPFALAGLLGICILGILFSSFFRNAYDKRLFQSFYLLFILLSISLVLHLREARYYSLVVLSVSIIFWVFIRHNFLKKFRAGVYAGLMTASLASAFLVFYPLYFAFLLTLVLWESYQAIKTVILQKIRLNFINTWELIKPRGYLILSIAITIPGLIFFKNLEVAEAFSASADTSLFDRIYHNISSALFFFKNYEFLLLYTAARLAVLALTFTSKQYDPETRLKIKISNFLTLFVLCYFVAVSNIPFFFERYYIALQPVLTVILLLDFFAILELASSSSSREKIALAAVFTGLFVYGMAHKINPIQGHIYEMFHPYRGPLDYAIPYIKDNFEKTQNLGIATDYEELSLMYYLDSRTIIGQLRQNLDRDQKLSPDIIIPRHEKYPPVPNHPGVYDIFFTKAEYLKVTFPVAEYRLNNIPELMYPYPHLFKTPVPPDPSRAFTIYVKEIEE